MGRHNKVDKVQVILMHLEGKTVDEIADELGCSTNTVRKCLLEAGHTTRTIIDKGKVIALARAGWKPSDIAWDMHIKEEEVNQVLCEHSKGGK